MTTKRSIDGNLEYRDIWFDDVPLNDWTDELRCFVTKVDGWWGPPEASVPVDERPYTEDGNYLVPGRNLARIVEIEGVCLPAPAYTGTIEGQNIVANWRDELVKKLNKVRETGTLTFYEDSGTKQLEVQVRERPMFDFQENFLDIIEYNIVFYAADPVKYNSTVSKQTVKITQKPPNIFDPDDTESDEIIQLTSSGRTYHDIEVGGKFYATFPRTYNHTSLWSDDKDSKYLSKIIIHNAGNTFTYGTIVMRGPVTNPAVRHMEQNKVLQLNLELTGSQTLTLNLKDKTALMDDGTNILSKLDFASQWFSFAPGINTLSFFGDDITLEQIGWAAATNHVRNPSGEYGSDLQYYIAATNLMNQDITTTVTEKTIDNQVTILNSSLADNTVPAVVKSTSRVTAYLSSWFGSEYNEDNKSIKIQPNVEGDVNTYITLNSTLNSGPVIFSADIATTIFSEKPKAANTACLSLSYRNSVNNTTTTLYGSPNFLGKAEIIANIPSTAVDVEYKIINGYSVDMDINPGTGVYEELSNCVFARNLYIGNQVLPKDVSTVPQQIIIEQGDMFEVSEPLTAEFISQHKHTLYTVGSSEIKLNPDYYRPVDDNYEELTVLYSLEMATATQTTVILRDPTGEELDIVYPMQRVEPNVRKDFHLIMDKPLVPFEIYLLISPVNPTLPTSGTLSKIALVDGKYYGHYFDNDEMGLTDGALHTGSYTEILRYTPYQYTPTYAAVDDLEELPLTNVLRKSSQFAVEGGSSIALVPPEIPRDGFVESARVDCINWANVPNGPVTVYATIRPSGNTYMPYTHSRCIGINTGTEAIYSEQAPLDDDTHQIHLKFNKTSNNIKMYLMGGATGYSETFFDGIMIVAGYYNDRYFNGGMELAVWAGTEHNSTSIQTARPYIQGSVSEVYYRDAWIT